MGSTFPHGALVGFLGPNGAGKTTAMRAIVGMVRLDTGTITWDGSPVDRSVRTRIGYMPQERGLYARMKVLDQVTYFGRLAGMTQAGAHERASYWLDRLGVIERADSMLQDLSGGNQQRVQLAVSLVHDPDLLVLDEPFAGLDPVAAETMRGIIAELAADGAAVLFSSHQLDLVEDLCEDVVIVARGRLVAAGTISELRASSPIRRLSVRWAEFVEKWEPLQGDLVEFNGRSAVVNLPAAADIAASVAHAATAGAISEIAVEPPGLDERFVDLVGPGGTTGAQQVSTR